MSVTLVNVALNSAEGTTIRKRFEDGWKGGLTGVPTVNAIYSISNGPGSARYHHALAYNTYLRDTSKMLGLPDNQVQQCLFWSASRACNLGDNAQNVLVCSRPECRLCCMLQNVISMQSQSSWDCGVYTTSHSSKATNDIKNIYEQSMYKVLVYCSVVVGRSKVVDKIPRWTGPPPGYQSVQIVPPSQSGSVVHPETIVYRTDAALPIALIVVSSGLGPQPPIRAPQSAEEEIKQICQNSGGRSHFFVYGSSGYKDSVRHYFESSAEVASSAVQPGSLDDLSNIIKALAKWKATFAIKGGGHATRPKFSSTTGIQIYMAKFDQVEYNSSTDTVDVGAGCLWDHVYIELEKSKRCVVGGARDGGVGVAGYLLGGGYSIKTNQFGLGIDNIVKIQVILPDGRLVETEEKHPQYGDLFVALKGGGSNFGIVTRFTLKTHYQGPCWNSRSGFIFDQTADIARAKLALARFALNERRPKAVVVGTFRHYYDKLQLKSDIDVFCFFDGVLPAGNNDPFQEFSNIRRARGQQDDPGPPPTTFIEAFNEFSNRSPARPAMVGVGEVQRGRFACIMVTGFTMSLIDEMDRQAQESAKLMVANNGIRVLIDVWPFLPTIFDKATECAWPHKNVNKSFSHLLAWYNWTGAENDQFWINNMKGALRNIRRVATAERVYADVAPIYLNTTLEDTPVQDIYRNNLPMLIRTRAKYDPGDVMGKTGGFRIPLA